MLSLGGLRVRAPLQTRPDSRVPPAPRARRFLLVSTGAAVLLLAVSVLAHHARAQLQHQRHPALAQHRQAQP